MNAFATNTGVVDTGGGIFWAFEGPSVSHLFTGFDSTGTVHNGTQHTADVNDEIFFDGQTWNGANDLMNPIGTDISAQADRQRTAWAMHDAWDYDIAAARKFRHVLQHAQPIDRTIARARAAQLRDAEQ